MSRGSDSSRDCMQQICKNHSVHWSKKQRFCAIAAFNRFVKYSLPSRQKLTLKTCPLETINDGDSCLICGWLSKATSSDFIGTGRSNIIRRSRMSKISLCINALVGSCKATRFFFATWHQWKWYGLIKSEMLWVLLCIAPLIPSFGNVVEVGVPKFLLNTASWWLKPLHTFCTGHIFEKSSLWNWISYTWASLGHSFHTVQQSGS